MAEKGRIRNLAVVGLVAWLALAGVVVWTDPDVVLDRVAFFVALYVGLLTWLAIGAYALSFRLFSRKRYRGNLSRSIQHSAVATTVCVLAALLQLARALSPLAGVLLIGVFLIGQVMVLLRR